MSCFDVTIQADTSGFLLLDYNYLSELLALYSRWEWLIEDCLNIVLHGICQNDIPTDKFYEYMLYDSVYHTLESMVNRLDAISDELEYDYDLAINYNRYMDDICGLSDVMTSLSIAAYESIIYPIINSLPKNNPPYVTIVEFDIIHGDDMGNGWFVPSLIRLNLSLEECYENDIFTISDVPYLRYNG